jgi:hypothetical protein
MFKLTVACTAIMAGLLGCGGDRASAGPAEGPPGVDFQFNGAESADSNESGSKSAESSKPAAESSQSEPAKAQPQRESAREAGGSPEACKGLTQKKCEIAVGCAWSTDKKCVPQ